MTNHPNRRHAVINVEVTYRRSVGHAEQQFYLPSPAPDLTSAAGRALAANRLAEMDVEDRAAGEPMTRTLVATRLVGAGGHYVD